MGKFETKKDGMSRKEMILTVCCMVLAITVVILLVLLLRRNAQEPVVSVYENAMSSETSNKGQNNDSDLNDEGRTPLVIYSIEEQGDLMLLKTSYGDLKYPYAFSDVIEVSAVSDGGVRALEFTARILDETYPIYTVYFSDADGMTVGTMQLPDDEDPHTVTVIFYEPDGALQADALLTFNAARDTFNEVWVSLADNEGFTPVDSN